MNRVTERKLGGLFIHARTCTISAMSSTHALGVVPSRHRSRGKRAILIISIVHSQFLFTTYELLECCLVVSFFYVFVLKAILITRAVCLASVSDVL